MGLDYPPFEFRGVFRGADKSHAAGFPSGSPGDAKAWWSNDPPRSFPRISGLMSLAACQQITRVGVSDHSCCGHSEDWGGRGSAFLCGVGCLCIRFLGVCRKTPGHWRAVCRLAKCPDPMLYAPAMGVKRAFWSIKPYPETPNGWSPRADHARDVSGFASRASVRRVGGQWNGDSPGVGAVEMISAGISSHQG